MTDAGDISEAPPARKRGAEINKREPLERIVTPDVPASLRAGGASPDLVKYAERHVDSLPVAFIRDTPQTARAARHEPVPEVSYVVYVCAECGGPLDALDFETFTHVDRQLDPAEELDHD